MAPSSSSPPGAAAAYKKRDGALAMSPDGKAVVWTPAAGIAGGGAVTIQVSNITSMDFSFYICYFARVVCFSKDIKEGGSCTLHIYTVP